MKLIRVQFRTYVSGKTLTDHLDIEPDAVDSTIRTYKKYGWDLIGFYYWWEMIEQVA